MKTKRLVAVVMIVLLAAMTMLTACGGDKNQGSGGGTSSGGSTSSGTSSGGTSDPTTTDSGLGEQLEYSEVKGKIEGDTYSNDFFKISYQVQDSNWYIADEKDMAQLIGLVADTVNDEALSEAFTTSGVVFDFYTMNVSTGDSINVVMQDVGLLAGMVMSSDALINGAADTISSTLTAQGMTNVSAEKSTTVFLGETTNCISAQGDANGITIYQKQVYLTSGRYAVVVTAATTGDDRTDDLIAGFKAI